jgi:hypothetical protein
MGYFDVLNGSLLAHGNRDQAADVSLPPACRSEGERDDLRQALVPGWEHLWVDLGGEG